MNLPIWYCGIDPGLSGAIAFYTDEPIPRLSVYDFVTVKGGSSSNQYHKADSRKEIAISETAAIFKSHIETCGPVKMVYLETPHSLPNDGHVGAFRFGKACGIIEGILGTFNLRVIPAMPHVWKKHLGLSSSKEKSLALAKEKFKNIVNSEEYFRNKKDHDRAEASLLAWYAHKVFGAK